MQRKDFNFPQVWNIVGLKFKNFFGFNIQCLCYFRHVRYTCIYSTSFNPTYLG